MRIEEAIKRRVSQGQRIQYSKLFGELSAKFNTTKMIDWAVLNLVKTHVFEFLEEKKILIRKK